MPKKRKGFTMEIQIDKTSWTAYYESVEELKIRRWIGANQEILVEETIKLVAL